MTRLLAWDSHFRRKTMVWLIGAVFCLAAPTLGVIRPFYNWDMLAYIGIVNSWHTSDIVKIHDTAYSDAKAFANAWRLQPLYVKLVNSSQYRRVMATDAQSFVDQFPFYKIRPLYLVVLDAVSGFTGSVAAATLLVSVFMTLVCNLVVATSAMRRLGVGLGLPMLAAFSSSPPIFAIARLSTADALATFVTVVGFAAFVAGRNILAAIILLFGVAARSDLMVMNVVLAACLALRLFVGQKRVLYERQEILPIFVLLLSVAIGKLMESMAGNYGYNVLYHVTFMEGPSAHPAIYRDAPIPFRHHLTDLLSGMSDGLANGGFYAIVICGLGVAYLSRLQKTSSLPLLFCVALTITLAIRMVLFPSAEARFMAPIFGGLFVVLIEAVAEARCRSPLTNSTGMERCR